MTITLEEAIELAKVQRAEKTCSTTGKALVCLLGEIERLEANAMEGDLYASAYNNQFKELTDSNKAYELLFVAQCRLRHENEKLRAAYTESQLEVGQLKEKKRQDALQALSDQAQELGLDKI